MLYAITTSNKQKNKKIFYKTIDKKIICVKIWAKGGDIIKAKNKKYADYKNLFNKTNYKNVAIRIRKDNINVIQKLESVTSKNAYIISLIEKDIKQHTK